MNQVLVPLVPYFFIAGSIIVGYAWHFIFHLLPAKQQEALKQLGILASPYVQAVEQLYGKASGPEKKSIVIETIELTLQAANLPVPDEKIINMFIEDAVFAMNMLRSKTTQPLPPLQGGNIDPHMAIDLTKKKGN